MVKLTLILLRPNERGEVETYLRLYQRCFNPDERVSLSVLRRVIVPSPARVNPVHLFAAYWGIGWWAAPAPWCCLRSAWCLGATSSSIPRSAAGASACESCASFFARSAAVPRARIGGSMAKSPPLPATVGTAALAQAGFRFFPARGPLSRMTIPARS